MPHLTTDDGVKLYYEETGKGIPIVFIHEFAGDYRSWEPQVRYFSRLYRPRASDRYRRYPAVAGRFGEGLLTMLCRPPSSRPTPWRAALGPAGWRRA